MKLLDVRSCGFNRCFQLFFDIEAEAASISSFDTCRLSIFTLSYLNANSFNASSPELFTRLIIFLTVLSRNSSSSEGRRHSEGHSVLLGLITVRIIFMQSFFQSGLPGCLLHPMLSGDRSSPRNHFRLQRSVSKTIPARATGEWLGS